jgi:MFS family permease
MFQYNVPGALPEGIEQELGIKSDGLAAFYTAYAIAGTLSGTIAGELIAKRALLFVCFACASILVVGSFCFAAAPLAAPGWANHGMLLAQLLNGVADSLGLSCSPALVSRWWRHNHMGLSMGVTLMVTQIIGAALPLALLPRLRSHFGLQTALWAGFLVQLLCFGGFLFYRYLERRCVRYLAAVDAADEIASTDDTCGEGFFARLRKLPCQVWLQMFAVSFIPVTQYIALGLLPSFLCLRYKVAETDAGSAVSVVWWFCVLAPLWGALGDRPAVGRLHIQVVATLGAASSFICLFQGASMWPVLLLMGACFSALDQNSYVCVEALVPNAELVGFTYGVMGTLFNLGLTGLSFIAGRASLLYVPLVFACSLGLGLGITLILLCYVDPTHAAKQGLLPENETRWGSWKLLVTLVVVALATWQYFVVASRREHGNFGLALNSPGWKV